VPGNIGKGGTGNIINFIKEYAKKHNLPFKDAMTKASKDYQKTK